MLVNYVFVRVLTLCCVFMLLCAVVCLYDCVYCCFVCLQACALLCVSILICTVSWFSFVLRCVFVCFCAHVLCCVFVCFVVCLCACVLCVTFFPTIADGQRPDIHLVPAGLLRYKSEMCVGQLLQHGGRLLMLQSSLNIVPAFDQPSS